MVVAVSTRNIRDGSSCIEAGRGMTASTNSGPRAGIGAVGALGVHAATTRRITSEVRRAFIKFRWRAMPKTTDQLTLSVRVTDTLFNPTPDAVTRIGYEPATPDPLLVKLI